MKIKSLFFLAFVLAMLGVVAACKDPNSSDSTHGGSPVVVTGATLAQKLQWVASNATSNTNYSLEVNTDEFLNPHTLSYSGKSNVSVQLTGIGGVKTVELYGSGSLFTISNGVTLVLDKNIVLKGITNNTAPLVIVNGGNLILNNGSKITGNRVSSNPSSEGSGVYLGRGTFTMNGGEISGNSSSYGSGVYADSGTFTMNGGEISGNTASRYGGGVYVDSGTFTMTGGQISGNTASNSGGGGVYVGNGTFTMKGGKISGNTSGSNSPYFSSSSPGGGVYVGGGTFTMTGGEISRNTASSYGGGVYIGADSNLKFEKTGGIITGYSNDTVNGNVVKNNNSYVQDNCGHAVYAEHSDNRLFRYKQTTAGPQNNLTYIRNEPSPPTISGAWDYIVSFTTNGGNPYPGQQYIAFGSKVIEPPTMSRTGYTFDGWYRETGFINLWNFNIDTVTENITLYAKWIAVPIPDAPGTPVITPSNGSLTVQWTAVQYATYYEVWSGTSDDSANAQYSGYTAQTSYTVTGLTNGTTYYVWLKASNTTGTSGFSPMAHGRPMGDIDAITIVSGNNQLALSWSAVAGADQYEVYYHTSESIPATPAQTVSTTTATVSGLTNGAMYYVWVKPKNAYGTGDASAPATGIPIGNMGAVTLTPGESGQLVLSWSAVAGADQYEVYHSTSESIPASPAETVTTTTATISSLTNGTTYYAWVKPKNANGTGNTSAAVSGVPLATPGNLTLSAANQQITVSWAAVAGASSYQVYYGTSTTIPASSSFTVTETSRTITGLTNGTTYHFWVKAVNTSGAGAASPMASGKPIGNMGTVTLTPGESGQLVLSWAVVAGADQYEVYYSTVNTMPSNSTQTVSVTTATISSLNNGSTYYVWVKPKNANGVGSTGTAASGMPIATPGNLTLSAANQQITVSWAAVSGASSYEVYYNTTTAIPASPSHTGTELSRALTGLTNGTTYYFWVKAVNANGAGAASPLASGRPVGNMGTVTLVSGNGQFVLSWAAVAGADQYEVYHHTSDSIPATPAQTVSTTTATINGLTNGTTYYVWVKPKNATGTGNASTVITARPLGIPGVPTVTPGFKQLRITWTAVPGADEYDVYYGTGTTPTTLAAMTTENITTITGLINGTTYYVRLRAKNANGISDYGPNASNTPVVVTSGLYRGVEKIGNQNLSTSLSYISANAVSGDDFYIVLGANESVSPATLNYSGKTVGITLTGYGSERTITLSSNGSMFTIPTSNANVTLTLDENITLVGRSTNTASLVYLDSGNLVINAGAKISGNNANFGGGICVNSGGTVTMNGGTISGNTASSGGGGIVVNSGGTVTMNGGTINGNKHQGDYGGGGIFVIGGTLTMYDGIISENTAARFGGGVQVYSNGSFTMHGGTISGNTSGERGGGVESSNGTFKKQPSVGGQYSGIIYGSTETGVDAGGAPLKNTAGNNTGHAVFGSSNRSRNTTAGQTDQIDATTGLGLSTNGSPPYGQ